MRSAVLLAGVVLLASGCGAAVAQQPTPSAVPTSSAVQGSPSPEPTPSPVASPSPVDESPSPSPEPTPSPAIPAVRCVGRPAGGPEVMIGDAIYDVTDAVHPRLLCSFQNTFVHLYTLDTFVYLRPDSGNTDVILHSMSSGNESVVATIPLALLRGTYDPVAWSADGSVAASWVEDSNSDPAVHISLYAGGHGAALETFPVPLADCICRFGLTPPVFSFSPDKQYLAVGWTIGKGANPISVYRVTDRKRVTTLGASYNHGLWAPSGHQLFVDGGNGAALWTPEFGLTTLAGSRDWTYLPNNAPGGGQIAYTGYAGVNSFEPSNIRVFLYDAKAKSTRMLTTKLRSEVVFVKPGWVWYHEEALCPQSDSSCGVIGSQPTDKDFAMNLATGTETPVVFASGEGPSALQSGWDAPEFWPNQ